MCLLLHTEQMSLINIKAYRPRLKSHWKTGTEATRTPRPPIPMTIRRKVRGCRAGLAQLVEHVICNHGVGGSNPSAGTTLKSQMKLAFLLLLLSGLFGYGSPRGHQA